MLGLPTIPKLLILAAVIALVWYFIRRGQVAKAESNNTSDSAAKSGARPQKPVEELIQCTSCGAYFPAKSGCSCGQSGR